MIYETHETKPLGIHENNSYVTIETHVKSETRPARVTQETPGT